MRKKIMCFILSFILCAGLTAPALAGDCVSAGDAHSVFIRDDGALFAAGIGELVDGSTGSG